MKQLKRLLPCALCAALLCSLLAAPANAVGGTVVGSDGQPLANAKVVCQIQENGAWRDWASESWQIGDVDDPSSLKEGAEDYGQNPFMYTDEDGRCGWMLPAGTFRFSITATGYLPFISAPFTVGTGAGKVDNSHNLGSLALSTPTPPPSSTPTPTPTPTSTPTPTPTVPVPPPTTPTPTPTSSPTPTPTASATPSTTPTPPPSSSPSAEPSASPSPAPIEPSSGGGYLVSSKPKTAELVEINLAVGVVPRGSRLTLTATGKKSNNVTFYYSTDGSTPNRNSTKYSGPIVIDKDMTVKVIAFRGSTKGTVESYAFTVSDPRPGSFAPEASTVRYLVGYSDGTFRPDQPATRYEVAEALNQLLVLRDGNEAATALFTDLDPSHASSVSRLVEVGLISGMGDGTFQGEGSLTRVQFCKLLCLALGLEVDAQYSQSFSDVAGHWGIGFIGALAKSGLLKGYDDGTFRPDRPVTRAELAVLLNRAAGREHVSGEAAEYLDVSSDFWAYEDIQNASLPVKTTQKE